ncbi:MAG: DUF1211 domain-containing protein [Rubrobacter sp.]|nr:DUF1211 domain-containing protein [Rubrobacter sp.]
MGDEVTGESGDSRELDRLVFFSDAVFAIVITILVLDIQVPAISPSAVSRELPAQLIALEPKFFSYVLSFLVVAIYWQAHHKVFRPIVSYDGTLIWLNFLFLLAISFLPFPTSLLGEYAQEQISVVLYAADTAAASLMLAAISWYAARGHRLVSSDFDDAQARLEVMKGLGPTVVFLLSIAVSFYSPSAATYTWLLLLVTDRVVRWIWSHHVL